MRGNEGVIGGSCGRHGGLSLRLRPDHGSPWRDPHFTDCVEEDRPVWRRPTPVAEEALWLWGRLRVCFRRTGRQKRSCPSKEKIVLSRLDNRDSWRCEVCGRVT